MSTVPTEIELKLKAPPPVLRRVLSHPLLKTSQRLPPQKLRAVYYDTQELELSRLGAALRVRNESGRWVQTLKWKGSVRAGLHERAEVESEVPGPSPDIAAIVDPEALALLQAARAAEDLRPIFETRITRTRRLIEIDGNLVEASFDRGEIRSNGHTEPVSEIELEFKRGAATALFGLALRLLDDAPVMLERRSKAERGYALYRGGVFAPVKAGTPILDPSMSVSAAFAAVAGTTLDQMHANEDGVLAGRDPEYLHQMRVGLRRLRSAISIFSDAIPEAARAPVANELRFIGSTLGPARDWDVFVHETLPMIRAAFEGHPELRDLAHAAAARQRLAQRKAARGIRSARYQRTGLTVGAWLAAESWKDTADAEHSAILDGAVRAYSDAELEGRYQRVRKRGRKLASLDAGELHKLRIAVKKLRYGVDFFASLYDAERVMRLRTRLSRLQDILGTLNDASTIRRLLDELHNATETREGAVACGLTLGWAAGRVEGMRGSLDRAWRTFRRSETFW